MTPRLVVVTPWYPSAGRPYDGVFVRDAVTALGIPAQDVLVVHLRSVAPGAEEMPARSQEEEAVVHRLDVPVPPKTSRAAAAELHRRVLERAAVTVPEIGRAQTVHAHVGVPGAWPVLGLLAPTARLVVTEHATFLGEVLAMPATARMYGEVLERAALLLTVGELEARLLRSRFPAHAGCVRAEGNPVRTVGLPFRTAPPVALDRWIYVGNLVPRKGVDRVVRAFAHRARGEPGWRGTLTLVGDGPQRPALAALVEQLGVDDRVTMVGRLASTDVAAVLVEHDVLVHLADQETFGLTVVEAVAAGVPVVVTRCGGPEETLGGAAAAGLVRFVDVRPEPQEVVDAIGDLARSARDADRAVVRHEVEERFGFAAFGDRLDALLRGAFPAEGGRPVVLGVAGEGSAAVELGRVHQDVLRRGGTARLITDLPGEAGAVDRRVEVVDLWLPLSRGLRHRLVTALLGRPAAAAGACALALAGLVARLPGAAGRVGRRGSTYLLRRCAERPAAVTRLHARIRATATRRRVWAAAVAEHVDLLADVNLVVAAPSDAGIVGLIGAARPGLRVVDVGDHAAAMGGPSGTWEPTGGSRG